MTKGAGAYDQWLTFSKLPVVEEQDPMGGPISAYAFHFNAWGAFEPIGSREFPVAQKRHAETTARFRIPWPDYAVDPARHRIEMAFDETTSPPMTSTWNIHGALPVKGLRFELLIEVSEIK